MKKGLLTLVDVEEGLAQLTGENGLRQVSEILFHHVGDVERRVALVGNAAGVRLHQVAQVLDTRLHPRLPEKAHLTGRGQASIFFALQLRFDARPVSPGPDTCPSGGPEL